ncbi:MAG: hypothetical protein ACREAU_00885 [Nitrosopumilaceae archaeon]
MMQSPKSDLKSAFVLLKCSKREHNDCRQIRDALIDQVGNIQEAYTTDAEINNEKWCVAASALIDTKDIEKFKEVMWNVKTSGSRPITVDNLELLVDNQ